MDSEGHSGRSWAARPSLTSCSLALQRGGGGGAAVSECSYCSFTLSEARSVAAGAATVVRAEAVEEEVEEEGMPGPRQVRTLLLLRVLPATLRKRGRCLSL